MKTPQVVLGASLLLLGCSPNSTDTPASGGGGVSGASSGGGTSGAPSSGGGAGVSGGGASGSAGAAGQAGSAGSTFSCTEIADPGEMVSVPAGDFVMGCNAVVDDSCHADEKPMRTVSLAAFEIDKTEVTQAEFTACVLAGSCAPPWPATAGGVPCVWDCQNADHPAGCITWEQAKAYCAWAQKRLPTEAEWEKAARGTDGRKYPWGNGEPTCNEVNMTGCGEHSDAVGAHPSGASPYGVLDMAGNMVEMVADWYDAAYYSVAPDVDPKGPASGTRYVGRGGGFRSEAEWQRASSRDWYDLEDLGMPLGFRCAR
jgi:formylglycine-generating enzyme required for sulfatase activity